MGVLNYEQMSHRVNIKSRRSLFTFTQMIRLQKAARAWLAGDFESVLKGELEALPVGQLPLQQGMRVGNYLLDEKPLVMIFSIVDGDGIVQIRIGVSYQGMIAGCSCADDPTPVEPVNEYCELYLALDKQTGEATVSLVDDQV